MKFPLQKLGHVAAKSDAAGRRGDSNYLALAEGWALYYIALCRRPGHILLYRELCYANGFLMEKREIVMSWSISNERHISWRTISRSVMWSLHGLSSLFIEELIRSQRGLTVDGFGYWFLYNDLRRHLLGCAWGRLFVVGVFRKNDVCYPLRALWHSAKVIAVPPSRYRSFTKNFFILLSSD